MPPLSRVISNKRKHHHGMVLSKRWGDVISDMIKESTMVLLVIEEVGACHH